MTEETPIDPRKAECIELAKLMYGDRWQLPLSQGVGVSQAFLSQVFMGGKPLSVDLEQKIAIHSEVVGMKMMTRIDALATASGKLKKRLAQQTPAPEPEPDIDPDIDDTPSPRM